MRVRAMLAGMWVCLLVGDAGVDASPCCGVAAVAVGSLAFAGVSSLSLINLFLQSFRAAIRNKKARY